MKLMEKIVLATDFSQAANDAMKTAIMLAKKFQSEITLIHVVPEIDHLSLSPDIVKNNIKQLLDNLKKNISDEGITTADPILSTGVPFDQISTYAVLHDANIIVLGAGETYESEKYRLGITAGRIIRSSKKPVWIVKKGAQPQLKKILCPVDFSDSSARARALKNAVHLARQFDCQLSVLHVIKPTPAIYWKMTKVIREEKKKAREYIISQLDQFLKKTDLYQVKWEKVVKEGNPAEEILAFISMWQPDLTVMGTAGRSGVERFLIGSVAEKITRDLPCSIVMVKSDAPIRLKMDDRITTIDSCMKQGRQLLESGFSEEAAQRFEYCIANDLMFAPAWEGLAASYNRLGREEEAKECLERANQIRQDIWEKQVRLEILEQMKKSPR
jgi:nucleotide-binding universal stress UspA family protein